MKKPTKDTYRQALSLAAHLLAGYKPNTIELLQEAEAITKIKPDEAQQLLVAYLQEIRANKEYHRIKEALKA